MRVWLLLVPGALLCAPVWAQEPGTVLRHDNFLVFEGRAGENVRIVVTSISRGPTYAEDLQVEVIDPSSERTLRRIVRLGGAEVIDYPVRADGLHAVRISSGWNAATARIEGAPWDRRLADVPVCRLSARWPAVLPGARRRRELPRGARRRCHRRGRDAARPTPRARWCSSGPGTSTNSKRSPSRCPPERMIPLEPERNRPGAGGPYPRRRPSTWRTGAAATVRKTGVAESSPREEYQPDEIDTIVEVRPTAIARSGRARP